MVSSVIIWIASVLRQKSSEDLMLRSVLGCLVNMATSQNNLVNINIRVNLSGDLLTNVS